VSGEIATTLTLCLTLHSVEWAELAVIDLAKAKTPEGRAEQAQIARDAMHKQGFFYVINHGQDAATVIYYLNRL
jgi:isopenicillin N synthase-like dioxygenase